MNTQTVSLNLSKAKAVGQIARIGQADSEGTTIEAHVYDGATPADLTGAAATFCMRLPDGTHFVEDGNCTISGNVVTYVVDEEHCAVVEGYTDEAYFRIDKGLSTYSTARFRVKVFRAASSGASVPESYSSEVEELIDELDDAIETATTAANEANAAAANADATADGVESRVQEMAQDAAETATADAEQRIQDAIDAMGDISELAVPLMSKDVRGGAKLEERGGLVLRDEKLGIGSLVQESSGAVRGSIAKLTAKGHAEQASTTGKNLAAPNGIQTALSAGVTWTYIGNGVLSANGVATAMSNPEPSMKSFRAGALDAGTYTASVRRLSGSGTFRIRVGKGANSTIVGEGASSGDVAKYTFEADGISEYYVAPKLNGNETSTNQVLVTQLELGSTATEYEPYTGGAPSPSPEFPQTIEVVRGHTVTGKTGRFVDLEVQGKNLLHNTATSRTMNGVTFTVNSDGSVTVNGTATALTQFVMTPILDDIDFSTAHVISGSATVPVMVWTYDADRTYITQYNSVVKPSIPASDTIKKYRALIEIQSGATVNGTVYPQLELGSTATAYEPYHHTTTPIPLPSRGWVAGLPDGTADVLTLDGAGKVEWELDTESKILPSSGWALTGTDIRRRFGKPDVLSDVRAGAARDTFMCTHFQANNTITEFDNSIAYYANGYVDIRADSIASAADFNAFLQSNPVTVLYPLATPVTEDCGYINPPSIDGDCQISIPELDALGVRYFVDDSAGTLARQWYERAQSEYADRITALEQAVAELATA